MFFVWTGIWIVNYALEIHEQAIKDEPWEGKKLTFIMNVFYVQGARHLRIIWPSLILITFKERIDGTVSADGDFPASQRVQLIQSEVDWKKKKCVTSAVCVENPLDGFQGSGTQHLYRYRCSWNTSWLFFLGREERLCIPSLSLRDFSLSPYPEKKICSE